MAKKKKKKNKKDKKQKEKDKKIKDALDKIKSRFGDEAVVKMRSDDIKDIDVISTGCPSLNMALGVGGVPRGRVIEIYGPEASGKTTLALHILAEAQKEGGVAAFVDAEHAIDFSYSRKIGINV